MEGQTPPERDKSQSTEPVKATAGTAPNGRESRSGVKVTEEENLRFFQALMEGNTPPQGIGASNADWYDAPDQ